MLYVAFDCVMPMLVEAGFISRPQPGIYEMCRQNKFTSDAKQIYEKSFMVNNEELAQNGINENNPYFEFIK